jgi:predicted SAM-dependent methyltransferase
VVPLLAKRNARLRRLACGPTGLRRPRFLRRREAIARRHLAGSGIEIGALNAPLRVSNRAQVRYVDRAPAADLRRQYPELEDEEIVDPDILDDGERLETVADESQDFVIANHFLEHCRNPIGALENMLRVLRPGGALFVAVPDKRHMFDRDRPVTTLEHLLEHAENGRDVDWRAHFEEWVRLVDHVTDEGAVAERVEMLMDQDYSIHYHVWTQAEIFELLLFLRRRGILFDIELAVRNEHENVFVLLKSNTAASSSAPAE